MLAGVSAVLLAVQNRPDYFLPAASRRRTRTRQRSSFEQQTAAGKRLASGFLFFSFSFPFAFSALSAVLVAHQQFGATIRKELDLDWNWFVCCFVLG